MSKEKQCYICKRTEQEVKTLLEKLSPEIPRLATDKENAVMVTAKTELFRDALKGVYRCVICECLLMDMAEDAITERAKVDLLTEGDLERLHFDISATVEPE
jgi:hypothetical protein